MSWNIILNLAEKFLNFCERKLLLCSRGLINIDGILARMSDKPGTLGFQVTNICNANCIFCGYQYLKRQKTILSMDLFKKAVDEFDLLGGGGIAFTPPVGEPLIDPLFIDKIQYAKSKKNVKGIGFFTNGILINKIGANRIISSGIDGLTVSIGGFDEQAYFRIFRVNSWNEVCDGLLCLLKENKLCKNKIKITLALRSDIPIWKLLKSPDYAKLKKYKFDLQFNINYDSWGGQIKEQDLSGAMRLRGLSRKIEPCALLYYGLTILSNGDVTLCGCRDLDGDSELVLGNIKDRTLLEMWHDERVNDIREGFYFSRYPKACQDCSFYNDLSIFRREKVRNYLIMVKDHM